MAAGIVYLRTNRFEVKLEGITFKARDFESVCSMDFLFPQGKIWASPPIVGIDVMRHPRDPSIVLLLLCFGVGCVILRFNSGDILPESIFNFLTDHRIHFVGFGIPEKKDLFPFEELGLTKSKADIGYVAAKILDDAKYKRSELAELARKVLRITRMIGLTEASSFERHEQIKCAICQLFITWAIAMALLNTNDKKKSDDAPKKSSFLKNLNSLPIFTDGWLKFFNNKKETEKINYAKKGSDLYAQARNLDDNFGEDNPIKAIYKKGPLRNGFIQTTGNAGDLVHDHSRLDGNDDLFGDDLLLSVDGFGTLARSVDDFKSKDGVSIENPSKDKPLKGILKGSSRYECSIPPDSVPQTPHIGPQEQRSAKAPLKRSVSFK